MRKIYYIPFALFVFFMTSCTLYKPMERKLNKNLPQKFELYTPEEVDSGKWWKSIESKQLNILIEESLRNNYTVQEALATVQKAWAVAIQEGSARFPTLSYNADSSYNRTKKPNNYGKKSAESYSAGLAASYEIDLWGRVSSLTKYSRYKFKSSSEDLFSSAMSVSAEVAQAWLKLIAVDSKIRILKDQLKTNAIIEEITVLRYKRGLSTALDVFQQRQTSASLQTKLPQYENEKIKLFYQLSVLLGRLPKNNFIKIPEKFPVIPDIPSSGLPSDLIARRPDIRKAGYDLKSAEWYVSSAKADRLPALRLTASYSFASNKAPNLFDNWIANLAAGLTGPIFNGGYKKAEVMRARFDANAKLAAYRSAVIEAISEVQTALITDKKQKEYINALEKQYGAASTTYNEAIEYYRRSATDYINVLSALNTKQSLELTRIDAKLDYYLNRISLYRSLGGTWMVNQYNIKRTYQESK